MDPFSIPDGRGDPLEITLQRLRRANAAAAPDERQPEMDALLLSMEGLQAAEEQLVKAAKRVGPAPQPSDPDARPDLWTERADASVDMYQGLTALLEAACAGMCLGMYSLSPRLQRVLDRSVLFPFFFVANGRLMGGNMRNGMTHPVQVLQRMVAAFYINASVPDGRRRMDPAAMLEGCLEEVWPGSTARSQPDESAEVRAARRLLGCQHWVPSLPEDAPHATSGGGGTAAGAAAGGAAASSSEGGQAEPGVSELGEELEAGLQLHCPGRSLRDVRRWAMLMWLDLAGTACLVNDPRAPSLDRLLLVSQQALSSGLLSRFEVVRVAHIVGKAVPGQQMQAGFVRSPRGAALVGFLEGGIAKAQAWRVHKECAALARALYPLLLLRAQGAGGAERDAALARLDQLMESCSAWVKRCKPWLPAATMQQLVAIDRGLQQQLVDLKSQMLRSPEEFDALHVAEAPDVEVPKCSHCGVAAMHLRACSACKLTSYCSKSCQVAHWRAPDGHKAECRAHVAAQQGGAQ
ncbi:hypothetical protein ABPG75_003010 [Micractinium tetrahymenae]